MLNIAVCGSLSLRSYNDVGAFKTPGQKKSNTCIEKKNHIAEVIQEEVQMALQK